MLIGFVVVGNFEFLRPVVALLCFGGEVGGRTDKNRRSWLDLYVSSPVSRRRRSTF